ncbi:MAG TPA: phosphoserine transaminase [Candidatus Avipropionibacterium avicola]|uniref:phosphoserine transaminase n=1 Tax=Candidatus Avipropionibacterium avicola TaxID=2840701 RepID=A0A9D1GWC2_9ACTN|nr:phosphoserine transaminase [Candidatus Avipropionibacterium avicola]
MTPQIPSELLPADGRFGSGPARIRDAAIDSLAGPGRHVLGTSHRQAPVRGLVGRVQEGLASLYDLPEGYEVVLGNGGSTLFWDAAICSLVEQRSAHGVFGEFSAKFAAASRRAPHLADPAVVEVPAGQVALPEATAEADVWAWAHNETSTGALAPIERIGDGLVVVDGTSAAGGVALDPSLVDVYYFAPQKCLGSDGGLWLALMSPAAIERIARLDSTERWIPESLSLQVAVENSRKQQTLNTPAIATLWLLAEQLDWMLAEGGLDFAARRSARSAAALYGWAEAKDVTTPFVAEPYRSPVVGTIDFSDEVDAASIAAMLRANGIVDTEPYRKLGRNQLRVGMYPSVEPSDVEALCDSIDWLLENS